jgi:hypothetical protein
LRCQPRQSISTRVRSKAGYRSILNSQHQTGSISALPKRNPHRKAEQARSKSNESAAKSAPPIFILALITVWLQVRLSQSPFIKLELAPRATAFFSPHDTGLIAAFRTLHSGHWHAFSALFCRFVIFVFEEFFQEGQRSISIHTTDGQCARL